MTDYFAGLHVNLRMISFGKFLALWSGTRCAIYIHSFIPRPHEATNERIVRVGYNHFIFNKAVKLWRKPSSNYLTGQIQGKQTILEVFKCEESVNLAHYFPYDVKLETTGL